MVLMEQALVRQLCLGDEAICRSLFAMMADVFEEVHEGVSDAYISALLAREDVWILAALREGSPIAGLTAFLLPLTRSADTEVFVYDVAVAAPFQRQGLGRRLMALVGTMAAARGIEMVWVAADNEDEHALDFYRAVGGAASQVTVFTFVR